MLVTDKRFAPLFFTQFLGAFNDNLFKSALLILIAFRPEAYGAGEIGGATLGAIAAGLFILPFFLFSAVAGELTDTKDKARVARAVKTFEILLMLIAAAGFYWQSLYVLMIVLFGMGVQSAFFGPVKYAVLPQYVRDDELISANGWVETATFLAILTGTIAGGLYAGAGENAGLLCAATAIAVALAGRVTAAFMAPAPPSDRRKPALNPFTATPAVLKEAIRQKKAFRAVPYISWFWFLGATYLAQLPFYVKDVTGGNTDVVTLFLAVFSVGIAIGSLGCEKITKGAVSMRAAPYSAAVMGVAALLLHLCAFFAPPPPEAGEALLSVADFFTDPARLGVLLSLGVVAAAGGVYIVPLYAVMQHHSDENKRAGMIAANNIVNALAMTFSAVAAAALTAAGAGVDTVFLTAGCGNLVIAALLFATAGRMRREQKGL